MPSTRTFREGLAALLASWVVVGFLGLITVVQALSQQDPTLTPLTRGVGVALAVVCTATFVAVQVLLVRRHRGREVALLAVGLAITSVLLVVLGVWWTQVSLAMAAVLLWLPGAQGVYAACALWLVVATRIVASAWSEGRPELLGTSIAITATELVAAVVLFVMTRLVLVLDELHRTREDLARAHVDEERVRIARDLHDILGRTLVAASLRNETAMRLLDVDRDRCRTQLEQIQSAIHDGQRQLRALTSGPVIVGLGDETRTAAALYGRLGKTCELAVEPVDDPLVDPVLAGVVREAVTNSLRHSHPRTCRISVVHGGGAVVLSVVNDGVPDPPAKGTGIPTRGTGLADQRARVEDVGGTLEAGPMGGGNFQVVVRIPRVEVAAVDRAVELEESRG